MSTDKVLERMTITEDSPGTILRDFETLLDFIGPDGIPASGKYHLLPMSRLRELDERMTRPLRPELKRPQQRSFPNLHGLCLLLRATCLAVPKETKRQARLVLEPDMLSQWQGLNATERYFNLLEAWLFRANPEVVGEQRGLWSDGLAWGLAFFRECPDRDGRIPLARLESFTYSSSCRVHLALAELFGLVETGGWRLSKAAERPVESVRATEWGRALFESIDREAVELIVDRDETLRDQSYSGSAFGILQDVFGAFFPEWKNNLVLSGWEYREGVFCFKVSLGRVWCRIRIPAHCHLDDLAWAIIEAYEFDGDHLYQFCFRDFDGSEFAVSRPEARFALATTEVVVGEMPIEVGQTIPFIYDFGAWWKFNVELEKIEPPDPTLDRPIVVQFHGTPPPEYECDEW